MPGSPIPPNLNSALPDATGTAHHPLEAPSSDWTSTMTTPGPATVPTATTSNKRRRDSMQQDIAGRDYYNNLKQSELTDLVVKLQEQNLILTRLLERSTLTATATTTTATSSNNRLNLNPVVNFTRTKSGSAASRYASEKDFLALNSGTKKGSAAIATKATTTTTATKSTTANVTKKKSANQKSSKSKHSQPPADAAEAKKWALGMFTTATDPSSSADSQSSNEAAIPPGYTCVYLPISPKLKHAVHSNYAPEIVQICETDGVNAITDFNPISGKNLGDPKLVNDLTDAQRNDKAKAIYYNRMLQAAVQLRDPRLGLTILKFFNAQDQSSDNHYIPSVIIDEYIKLKPNSVRKISAANTARSVLKGFDASQLFASLADTNVDTSITVPSGSNSSSSSTAANSQPTFNLAMLNVSGISTSLDLVIQYIETNNIDILLLTETFLLKGDLFTQWAQHHQYATISGDASKGNGGLTFLIRPHFPYYVHRSTDTTTSTTQQHHRLSIVIGNSLTIHGFYLPPALSFADYQTVLSSVDFNSTSSVICLGDFNTRLGIFTGDTRSTNPRCNYLLNWLTVHQANLWNRICTFGQPTFESN
ncbi:hypothetical protein PS15p_204779 [Mucor circinelloides]